MRPSKGGYHEAGHVDQLVDGYRPRLTPRNLDGILAKGQSSTDLIHTQSAQVFGSFGHRLGPQGGSIRREATSWAGTRRSTFGQRKAAGQVRNRTGHHARGEKKVWGRRPRSQPERPTERASSKAGDRTTPGCSGVPRTRFCAHPAPRPSSRGDSDKGRERTQHAPTARMQAASRTDGEGTAGVVDPGTGEELH